GDDDGLRDTLDQVAAFDLHIPRFVERRGRSDFHLDLLGRALSDQKIIFALDVLNDGLIHLVAGYPHTLRVNDAGERDHRDVGRSASDVDDHVTMRLRDREPGPDRGGHRLLDQIDLGSFGAVGAVFDRAPLNLCDLRRNADDDPRADPLFAAVSLLNKIL